tara:strand:- start:13806 stop:16721 length:2916 start_codon:yes stop_codon:yes gene_type:complete
MKRLLLIIFCLSTFLGRSQIVADSVRAFNCYHDGAIFLDISLALTPPDWYFDDNLLGWIPADTMAAIQMSNELDTLITQQCGSYKVVLDGVTSFYFVGCPLGSMGQHLNVECFGDSTGMLKRVAHSGVLPYSYQWFKDGFLYSSGPNDTLLEDLVIGNYTVIITDADLCSDTITSIITSPSILILDSISISDINCRGLNSGVLTCSFSGGRPYADGELYDYYLIDPVSNDTVVLLTRDSVSPNISSFSVPYQIIFDSLFAGDYILSVVDSFGCTLDTMFEVQEPEDYIAFGSTTDLLICESDSGYLKIDSVAIDSILGSSNIAFGFTYDVINGVHIDSIYVVSGWYDIYVYDSTYFCLDTVPIKCQALYEIEVFESINPVFCFGDQSGSIIIDSINGGNAPYDVQWGGVNNLALSSGSYLVHIVDSIGCLHTSTYIVSEGQELQPNEVIYPSLCYGDNNGSISIDILGGTGTLNYYWLNGAGTSDSLYNLSDGVYGLVVADSVGCVDTIDVYLQSPASLELNLIPQDSVLPCFGASTVINAETFGGTAPYSILWSDGDTSQQRLIGAGYYEIQVVDANSCFLLDSISIIEPDSLEISIVYTDMTCAEGATASLSVSGGVPPYSYLWNTGDTTSVIDSLFELIYWVVVTDLCGVSISDTVYLGYYELNTDLYYDDSSHTAEVFIESTTSSGPFEYSWLDILSDTIGNAVISPILCEGIYFAITTDISSNCIAIDTLTVEFYTPLGLFDITSTTIYPDSSLWGFPPYTYLWSNGQVTLHADICPGDHWVEVVDVNNCLIREDFTIEDIIITLDPASAIIECDIENLDVDLTASASGGTSPYYFEWWNGSVVNPINLGISPGNYSVSVLDDNGCAADTSFVIATMTSECIPNVFTPNDDDINDTWSLEDSFLFEDSEVKVYNRFGRLVFQSIGYHDQWDGTNEKGDDVVDGVYFYSIEIGNGFDKIIGAVTILR